MTKVLPWFWLGLTCLAGCTTPEKIKSESYDPKVVDRFTVAPDIIVLTIDAGKIRHSYQEPYQPQEGDSIIVSKEFPLGAKERVLIRDGKKIGWIAGKNNEVLTYFEAYLGSDLDFTHVDRADNYSITGQENLKIEEVWRKSKPTDWAEPDRHLMAMQHKIYLKLSAPLTVGQGYTINLGKLNTQNSTVKFVYEPINQQSEAVHVTTIGYRPDDVFKRAFLSEWMGSGGALDYPENLSFWLISKEKNQKKYEGKAKLAVNKDSVEATTAKINMSKTNVYHLEFSEFDEPGVYRIYVDGVGVSPSFEISEQAWSDAFKVSMKGFYNIRSGKAVGAPYSDFERPDNYMPGEQVQVYQSTGSLLIAGGGLNALNSDKGNFTNLVNGLTDTIGTDAWGGYNDAGDWDRRIQHLFASNLQLELLELFEERVGGLDLNIPESENTLPDILDEVLYNLDFYKKLQLPDGGIRGGIEAAEHPIDGETSWLESLKVMVYAPDHWSSFIYVSTAAKVAHYFKRNGDDLRADEYLQSAIKAMEWGEKEYASWVANDTLPKPSWEVVDIRNLAALELYRTSEDKKWYDVFYETSIFHPKPYEKIFSENDYVWDHLLEQRPDHYGQRAAFFLLARMDNISDELREKASNMTISDADKAIEYQQGNAYNLTTPDKHQVLQVGYFSSAGGAMQLCRAHYLTQDAKYLEAAIKATQYAAGANPMNIVYMAGLSDRSVKNLLHIDSRLSGQDLPAGYMSYGQFDYHHRKNSKFWMWPITYLLKDRVHPDVMNWPINEWFFDVYRWPIMTEGTPMEIYGPNGYVWGYLAAR